MFVFSLGEENQIGTETKDKPLMAMKRPLFVTGGKNSNRTRLPCGQGES